MKRLSLTLCAMVLCIGAFAGLRGIVVDKNGNLISGVTVKADTSCSKLNKSVTTSYDGFFDIDCEAWHGKITLKLTGKTIKDAAFRFNEADTAKLQVLCVNVKAVQDHTKPTGPLRYHKYEMKAHRSAAGMESMGAAKIMPEAMPILAEEADATALADVKYAASAANNVHAGMLTAGEVNDFAKWHLWENIREQSHSAHAKTWNLYPKKRYTLHLTNRSHSPLYDAEVLLLDADKNVIWQARTDNTGKAELWADMNSKQKNDEPQLILVRYKGIEQGVPVGDNLQVSLDAECPQSRNVDVMFIVDATGSMGDEIRYMQAELENVVDRVHQNDKDLVIRTGAVFYRDHGDDYLCRISTLSAIIDTTQNFMKKQEANGGGDYEEAVGEAMMATISSSDWSKEAVARIAFLILDAPPHNDSTNVAMIQEQLRRAAAQGIRLVPVVCSGMQESGEYLFRSMALATNGTNLFLTDDSGIGDTHLKPTTDKIEVEMLNDMMVRVINEFSTVPDCQADQWAEQNKDENSTDKFVPNPFDIKDLEGYDATEQETLTPADVLLLHPNPCSGYFQVQVLQDVEYMFLTDMTGKTLQNLGKQTANTTLEVNVGGYSTGIYFVKAFRKGKWYTQKEIVK